MIYYPISALINALASSIFGVLAYVKNPLDRKNRLYAFYCLTLSIWSYCYFCWRLSTTESGALFFARTLMIGAILIPVVHLHHLLAIFGWKARKLLAFGYITSGIYLISNVTPLLVSRVESRMGFKYWLVAGPLFYPYTVGFAFYLGYCLFVIYRAHQKAEGEQRNSLAWLFWATLIGYGGGATNFPLCYNLHFPPMGNILVTVYTSTAFYIIARHRLVDIRIIIRRTLVYSVVTAVLTAIYVMITTIMARGLEGGVVSPGIFSSAIAACAMALLFHPLRMKIQRFVDRHFFRESLDQALLREATSGFAHEIKRPLARISLPAELGLMDLRDLKERRRSAKEILPKIEQRLRYIINQAADAGKRIEAISEFSVSEGKPLEELNLPKVIRRGVSTERAILRRGRVEVDLDIADDLPAVKGHPKQLEIVLGNLIKNAAEAMASIHSKAGRFIRIKVFGSEERVTISVKDSGPGIKRENLPHLFEPFFTTKGTVGTGIGLYLCKQIIQAHDGTIQVRSEEGRGTEFIVRLPI